MIVTYLVSAVLGLGVFFVTRSAPFSLRLGLAFGVFCVLSIIATLYLVKAGDPAPIGAREVTEKELREAAR